MTNQKIFEIISHYLYSQLCQSENTVQELQRRVRFRKIDVNDSIELTYALARHEAILQFTRDINYFLNFRFRNKKIKTFVINPNWSD